MDVHSSSSTQEDANPGRLVVTAVAESLELAATWLSWDGRPLIGEDPTRIYTPHKVIRRIGDHLIDHLAEMEALIAGVDTQADGWQASTVTMDSDWARFTEVDLEEARERLTRLARTFELRLASVPPAEWDRPRTPNWTLRQLAEHVGDSWYADQIGRLESKR